ncbi:MAG: hypothetical protein U5K84_05435 [Alkalibacterium sp.]|nr:hypothetical protein [Alkalibacterium sp.]
MKNTDRELKQLENREEQVDGLTQKNHGCPAKSARHTQKSYRPSENRRPVTLRLCIQEQLKELYMENVNLMARYKGSENTQSNAPAAH